MKILIKSIAVILFATLVFISCKKDDIYPASKYQNLLSFEDNSIDHPNHNLYQAVIDEYVSKGIIGTSVMIKDTDGTWLGAGGSSDLASNIPVQVNHQFLIASISKIFTATVIYSLVDEGILSIDDNISKWLNSSIINKIGNGDKAKISHLLAHTSGIPDYYTTALEMARYNKNFNNWTAEDILSFTYDKSPLFSPGQTYSYSNTNFLLLGLIIEQAMGKTLKEAYNEKIFSLLNLKNAYFDVQSNSIPSTAVKGYMNLYGNGYVESKFLYQDEMGTGDGGIVITAQDLGVFIDALLHGEIISNNSLDQMQDWFDIKEDDEDGKNGFGLEYFSNDYGVSYGHTGGIDGFTSFANYYPEKEITIIVLINFSPGDRKTVNATLDFLDAMNKAVLN